MTQFDKNSTKRSTAVSRTTSALVLYLKPDCHLCEEARDVVREALPDVALTQKDITREAALMERFGPRIPVLERTETGATLDWPFGPHDVAGLFAR